MFIRYKFYEGCCNIAISYFFRQISLFLISAQTPPPIVVTTQSSVSPQTGYPSIKESGFISTPGSYVSTPPPIIVSSQTGIFVSAPVSGASTTPYPTIINQKSYGSTGIQVSCHNTNKPKKINHL